VWGLPPGLWISPTVFQCKFQQKILRFVWGSRWPADYDQKYIEDEEQLGPFGDALCGIDSNISLFSALIMTEENRPQQFSWKRD
jgi:hypothetical protein